MKQEEFDKLLADVIEGEASAEQLAAFERAVVTHPEYADEARKQLALHGELSIVHESEFQTEKWMQDSMDSISDTDSVAFSDKVVAKINRKRWQSRLLAIAAVLIIGFVSILFINQFEGSNDPVENPTSTIAVAKLKRAEAVQWKSGAKTVGASITAGQTIQIESGLLELDLEGRGNLIIEGPARVDFTSSMEAVLHRGSLVMRATEKGHGYTVKTPKGKVIDLGTEFAVSVGDDNTVETHVIDGSVQAVANNGESRTLLKNDAVRFVEEGNESISADLGRFYTALPPLHSNKKFIQWNFNEGKGDRSKAFGELGKNQNQNHDLIFHSDRGSQPPVWQSGVVGQSIYLDGKGAYAQSNYRGIQGGKARSVSFWLKVPQNFSLRQGFGIVSWGDPRKRGATWQISVNPMLGDGEVGRLRLGLHGGQIIGSTDLRDGKWHHIAVVLYGGSKPNVGTHALLYVDGKKEVVSRASLQEVKTAAHENHGVWVGRNVTQTDSKKTHPHGGFFRGGIDELYIFDAALSPEEVRELMTKSTEP